jgi:putative ABC transport system permease protein
VGVGVTTAAYSVVAALFWEKSPVPDPDRAVLLLNADSPGDPRWVLSRPDFDDLAATQRSFASLAASQFLYPAVELSGVTEIRQAEGVDDHYFAVLGATPFIGRFIQAADIVDGAPSVVVVSHALWRRHFGEAPDVVGQTLRIGGRPFEVIGVAPAGFEGPLSGPRGSRLWVTLPEAAQLWGGSRLPARDQRRLTAFGRLRPGVDVRSATAELAAIGATLDARYPRPASEQPEGASRRWSGRSVKDLGAGAAVASRLGWILLGLVALVLAVACTNLANLVLARGTARHQEVAVRRALGASRWRLVREQTAESVLIALAGGLTAWPVLLVLRSVLKIDVLVAPGWIVSLQPDISLAALMAAGVALLLCLVVFGLEPALQLTRKADVRGELVASAGSVGVPKVSRQRRLLRWQVAVSTGFFIVTSLCVRYLVLEARHESGMDLDRLAVASVDFGLQRWDETRARDAIDRILEDARREPGVDAVAASAGLPFGNNSTPWARLTLPVDPDITRQPETALAVLVTPGFFRATGISILRGRAIDERDSAGALPAMVIGESSARRIFGTADVVDRQLLVTIDRLRWPGAEKPEPAIVTVAGVAEDTDTTHFMARAGSTIYLPLAQEYSPGITLIARAARPADGLGALRSATRRAAPDLGLVQAGAAYTILAGPYVVLRTIGMVALTLGGITLLLAMAGLFGVQSHVVSHRTREIGVRMSFGASPAQIRTMVLRDGYKPVLQGLALGVAIGIGARAVIQSQTPVPIGYVDGWMLVMVPLPLLLAAFFACWLPARRAATVDPNVALRHL